MNSEKHLIDIIKQGEGLTTEFKESCTKINKSVYATVCSFLNRHGGHIFLGVSDAGEPLGVNLNEIINLKKEFASAINNPQKINPPCYLAVDEHKINEKVILHIFVPESSQVHRCNGRIFDRNEDSDIDITDNTHLVSTLYQRKSSSYSENKIYPFVKISDLREDLIARARKLASLRKNGHPWKDFSDEELVKSAQLYQVDQETGKSGITLAGILLLGSDSSILTAVPHHKTDLILRKVNLDRYDDRDDVRTNLIESYERIMAFIKKHLPDPFHLENLIRFSLRDAVFREVASNMLIHREYLNPFPAKLIIEQSVVRTENSNKAHGFGPINPKDFSPFPKNPVIAKFFREIGFADELGSGVRKITEYGKKYGGEEPKLIEGDVFKIHINYPDFSLPPQTENLKQRGTKLGLSQDQVDIIHNCLNEKAITELMALVGRTNRTKFRDQVLKPLLEMGLIEMTIPDKPTSSNQRYRATAKGQNIQY